MKNLFKYILTLLAGGDRNRGDFDQYRHIAICRFRHIRPILSMSES